MSRSAPGAERGLALRDLLLGAILPIVFLIQGLATLSSYGETFDEGFDRKIGHFYLHEWAKRGIEGLNETFFPIARNYGPLFDVVVVASQEQLTARKIIDDPVAAGHLPVLVVAAAAAWFVFLFAARAFGFRVGLLSSLVFCLMPQVVGHSQNNLKDTPLLAFFAVSVAAFHAAVTRDSLPRYLLAGALAGLAYTVKLNALLLYPVVGLWFVLFVGRSLRAYLRFALGTLLALVASVGTIVAVWPYYRFEPWKRFPETIEVFRTSVFDEEVFYLGKHLNASKIPWHFPFVQLGVTTPLLLLALAVVALYFTVRELRKGEESGRTLGLLWLWLLVPLVFQAISGARMYDGARHYLYVLPALAVLAAYGAWAAISCLSGLARRGAVGLLAAGLVFILAKLVALHPYQVVYHNLLTGGIRGAAERFELDYWGTSYVEAARWVKANTPPGSRFWLPVGQIFFPLDDGRSIVQNQFRRPNYKIVLIRGMARAADSEDDYLHPRRRPVHTISRDGADLLRIYAYPENADIPDDTRLAPQSSGGALPGLAATLYLNGEFKPPADETFVRESPELDSRTATEPWKESSFSLALSGFLKVETGGRTCFVVSSDDDLAFSLAGRLVAICNSGRTVQKWLVLSPGFYPIELRLRNEIGPSYLRVRMGLGACGGGPLDPLALSH